MQSAYVQAMPGVGHMATQAGIGVGPDGVGVGGSGGFFPQHGSTQGAAPVRGSGAAAGTQVGGRPFGSVVSFFNSQSFTRCEIFVIFSN